MGRLSLATLKALPEKVRAPNYDPRALPVCIVHLGLGAFHRAHQAVYTEDTIERGDWRWGTVAASLRSPDTRDALAPQDGLYTLAERDASGEALRVIGGLRGILVANEDPARLVAWMCAPDIKIVSVTVTEKGYCHDPATGDLNEDHPDIRHDLENAQAPRTAPGFIVSALAERRRLGLQPFTVLTCDNLPANGRTVKKVLARMAELREKGLGAFVENEVSCPSTVLDRIVPATTAEDRARISGTLGLEDAWPVVTERFTQWVVENDFPEGRPDWAAAMVKDAAPYELMKLRLLNGAHSPLAYLGCLAGFETVAGAMADPALAHFVEHLMRKEVAPVLKPPPGADIARYTDSLLGRFRNPALRHRCAQIAMDGSQKLPQRLLGTIRERLKQRQPIDALALGVAAWMRHAAGVDETGGKIEVSDPMAEELRRRADEAGLKAEKLAPALLGIEAVFGGDLPKHAAFKTAVTAALDSLIVHGAKETLARFQRSHP